MVVDIYVQMLQSPNETVELLVHSCVVSQNLPPVVVQSISFPLPVQWHISNGDGLPQAVIIAPCSIEQSSGLLDQMKLELSSVIVVMPT